jgi:hypothetical protein
MCYLKKKKATRRWSRQKIQLSLWSFCLSVSAIAPFLSTELCSSPWQSLRKRTELEHTGYLRDPRPPVWITDTALRKSPFVPQMGDEVRVNIENMGVGIEFTLLHSFLLTFSLYFPFVGNLFSTGSRGIYWSCQKK